MNTTSQPRQGVPLRPDYNALTRDYRQSFVRNATNIVLSEISVSERRSAVTQMRVADLPGGSVVKLMTLAPRAAFSKLFEFATRVDMTGISSFSFPLPTTFANAQFIGEGNPIPVRQLGFVGFPLDPVRKVALISALSRQLETASGGTAEIIISAILEIAIGRGIDSVLFSNLAATGISPAGLLYGVAPITPTAGGGFAAMSADLKALVSAIAAAQIDTSSIVFVVAPSQAITMALTAGPHFTGRIIEAATLASGTVIAVATAGLIVGGEGTPQISVSRQATLHMADPASHIAMPPDVMSAPTSSMMQTDMSALKCTALITWAAAPNSVSVISGCTW